MCQYKIVMPARNWWQSQSFYCIQVRRGKAVVVHVLKILLKLQTLRQAGKILAPKIFLWFKFEIHMKCAKNVPYGIFPLYHTVYLSGKNRVAQYHWVALTALPEASQLATKLFISVVCQTHQAMFDCWLCLQILVAKISHRWPAKTVP